MRKSTVLRVIALSLCSLLLVSNLYSKELSRVLQYKFSSAPCIEKDEDGKKLVPYLLCKDKKSEMLLCLSKSDEIKRPMFLFRMLGAKSKQKIYINQIVERTDDDWISRSFKTKMKDGSTTLRIKDVRYEKFLVKYKVETLLDLEETQAQLDQVTTIQMNGLSAALLGIDTTPVQEMADLDCDAISEFPAEHPSN